MSCFNKKDFGGGFFCFLLGGWIEDGSSALARGLVDHSYLEPWDLGSALARHSSMMQHLPLYHLHTNMNGRLNS